MKRKQGLSLSQSENRSEWGLGRAFCGAVWRGVMPHLGHRSYASMRKPNSVAVALQLRSFFSFAKKQTPAEVSSSTVHRSLSIRIAKPSNLSYIYIYI